MKTLMLLFQIACLLVAGSLSRPVSAATPSAKPLQVMLIPADGGTESGTRADFQPLFDAVSRQTGLRFELKVGQSYAAVVEAMKAGLIDLAWFGPTSYVQARAAGAAELLAVSVQDNKSVYYAGIFVRHDAGFAGIRDLRGKRVAFGDVNSSSSFTYQIAMLIDAGLDPARDLAELRLTGSHAASLAALAEGRVDAACLSFESWLKAADSGVIKAADYRVLARSDAIPNPPLAMSTRLPAELKARLRAAFAVAHLAPGVKPGSIRGYGGKPVQRYDVRVSERQFDKPAEMLQKISAEQRAEILSAAAAKPK
jgi:phosphonate transport system substrate-binding protein